MFKFNDRKPKLVSKIASGGTRPVSVTVQGDRISNPSNAKTPFGFEIKSNGSLTGITPDGITGNTGPGSGPIDLIISRNGQFLSSLNSQNGTISNFKIESNGSLKPAPKQSNLPLTVNGLVAR